MTTNRVPMTFGLMADDSKKKSYIVRYYINDWGEIPVKAESIDKLRKIVIEDIRTGYNEIYVKNGKKSRYVGTLLMSLSPGHAWRWNVGNKFWNIDPKTGKLRRK